MTTQITAFRLMDGSLCDNMSEASSRDLHFLLEDLMMQKSPDDRVAWLNHMLFKLVDVYKLYSQSHPEQAMTTGAGSIKGYR